MFFRQIFHEQYSCLSYVVGCKTRREAAIIDPQGDPLEYAKMCERNGMNITAVIDTHIHADHKSCARKLSELAHVQVLLGPDAKIHFSHQTVQDGEVLEVGNRKIQFLHTPGHTKEHVTLYVDNWFLLTGDTLFVGDVGRVDLPSLKNPSEEIIGENARALYQSIARILAFPEWTEIYPGHYAGSVCGRGMDGKTVSTLGREKLKNKPLKLSQAEFIEFQKTNLPQTPKEFQDIVRYNRGEV